VKDKKMVFIEPLNKIEQENWLDKLIQDILTLNKKEFADLLTTEIEYMLNLIIPELEKEPIIIEVEAPVVISGDIHG
jgi:HSP20 family molecular chaperone IbpA